MLVSMLISMLPGAPAPARQRYCKNAAPPAAEAASAAVGVAADVAAGAAGAANGAAFVAAGGVAEPEAGDAWRASAAACRRVGRRFPNSSTNSTACMMTAVFHHCQRNCWPFSHVSSGFKEHAGITGLNWVIR